MSKEYSDLLKDPRWQKLKALAMIRDNFTCQECGATDKTLHVHHTRYTGNPWDAPLDDLVTLCEDCHKGIHTKTDDCDRYVVKGKKGVFDFVRQLCYNLCTKSTPYREIDVHYATCADVVVFSLQTSSFPQHYWFKKNHNVIERELSKAGLQWVYVYEVKRDLSYPFIAMFIDEEISNDFYSEFERLDMVQDSLPYINYYLISSRNTSFRDFDNKESWEICMQECYYIYNTNDKQDGCKEGRAVPA